MLVTLFLVFEAHVDIHNHLLLHFFCIFCLCFYLVPDYHNHTSQGSQFSWVALSIPELRNVNYFTQGKSFESNLTPRKARKSQQIKHLNLMKFRRLATSGGSNKSGLDLETKPHNN